ncbi:cytochrome P450 [Leucobacter luti]|uniref:cytochrome P450 n=1 Tax=Leucobacter luti TaxID=340320 RepID=UPI001C693BE9|nr:cytochrome P450 [Leucobacter luti]QYM76938.1 cytochrome P450 [Leucobacter luti]
MRASKRQEQDSHTVPDPGVQCVAKLTGMRESAALLRAKGATTQAGFTSERIPARLFRHRPILMDDGPEHLEHRKRLVRFFSPRTLEVTHRAFIERAAADLVADAQREGRCRIDDLALIYSVRVASEIVGLNGGDTEALARRLEAFFRQPPVDHTRRDHGRTQRQWARAAKEALVPLMSFYWRDVRPAIRARRAQPADDIISHLLAHGYRPREILMECLTYGTAGMVTTREFMTMALWRLLRDPALCAEYLAADVTGRTELLSEMIRLEPPVAHLYRRVREQAAGCPHDPGTLVDIDVRAANLDPDVFGPEPATIERGRGLPAAERTGLSFGDGAHRCPGSHLALLETETLLTTLLEAGITLAREPDRGFDTLVQGYQLRGLEVSFTSTAAAP